MGKYKSFSEQPQEVQLRGDRLIIFRETVNMLLAIEDSQLLILIKPFLKWFSDGGQYPLSDPLMAFVYQKLIDEHMRAFEHAKAKCLTNKENRSKGNIKQQPITNSDGRQPSSPTVNHRQQVKAKGEVEAKAKAQEKEKFKSQEDPFPPSKELFFSWGKKFGIWPIALEKFYAHAESISWKTTSGPLRCWKNYFKAAFEKERDKKLKEQDDRFERLTGYEGKEFTAERAVLAAKLYAAKHNMPYKNRDDDYNCDCIIWPDTTGFNMDEGYWLLDKSIEAGENEWQYHSGNNNKPNWEPLKV